MKLHRFYVHQMHNRFGPIELGHTVWIHDQGLLHQWLRVLRYNVGNQLILFNNTEERLYQISKIDGTVGVQVELVTDMTRLLPKNKVYLLWSLLKNDKNDWVLQKATELGVHKLVPIIAKRTEKTFFDTERAQKIITEATEQCGRADLPIIREPIMLAEAIAEYKETPLLVCEQHNSTYVNLQEQPAVALLVGPEGGWADEEKQLFTQYKLNYIAISAFTLRAETAAILAVGLAASR
ncbi:MAG: rRNA (uracil1498-N3)-methyltransferase [Patescibacteria group bacterium]|nr:rRNA (uracil1498-N3)-methyltransferase [Patescibacteria group bacterium]